MQPSAPLMAGETNAPGLAPARGWALTTVTHLALLAVAVLIYLLAIRVRTDLATGWVDSAIYHALFLDTQAMQDRFGDVYFLSRWPWVLTGQAFYALFPLAVASFMMTWVVSWLYGAAFFLFLRQYVQSGAALGAAIILSCNLYITQTIASGYPSVASSALLMGGAALTVAGNRLNAPIALVLGGLAYGFAVMTHNFAAYLGFFLHLSLLGTRLGQHPWKTLVRNELIVLAAAVMVLPISVLALRWMGSSELAFITLRETTQQAFQGRGDAFRKAPEALLQDAGAFIALAAGLVAVVISWLMAGLRWSAIPHRHRVVHIAFLVVLGAGIGFDLFSVGATLQYGFYQVFHLGLALMQFGVLFDRIFAKSDRTTPDSLAVAALTIAIVLAILGLLDHGDPTAGVFRALTGISIIVALTTLLVCAAKPLASAVWIAVPIFIVIAGASGNFSRYSLMVPGQGKNGAPGLQTVDWVLGMADNHSGSEAPLFVAYDRNTITLGETYPISNDRWYFFFRNQEYFFSIFDTLAGSSLWDRGLIATTVDDFTTTELDKVLADQGKAAALVMWQGSESFTRETWDRIEDRGLYYALAGNPEFRHTLPIIIWEKLAEHGLYIGTTASGQYTRPNSTPFNYVIFDVTLPDPAAQ